MLALRVAIRSVSRATEERNCTSTLSPTGLCCSASIATGQATVGGRTDKEKRR